MPVADKRIDVYILKAERFAQPVLNHLRELVHIACPGVQETMKWSFPHFEYNGSILCSMAAFKKHCAFGFWKASLMKDPHKLFELQERTAMGHLGRIESISDLPPNRILISYIKEAARLNKEGVKLPSGAKPAATVAEASEYMIKVLKKNKKAWNNFEAFSPGQKKEYIEWITGAKTEPTRNKRLSDMLEWVEEGKIRNWKYLKK
ncbi:YdeI/OmpD-associated family protein [Agriterribacter sp.]|uniref:YdeI/OmpD-associated family protein n=1 Tax=Agriterribacter sp. TaxID=2821509 RepID=UPI002BA53FEB|nr:YdeI/OmpD-associated family protein [Agriterribacter sp.]HRP57781.1 YdeI/OmpD-associated family protein [Agriterribacter sp.]